MFHYNCCCETCVSVSRYRFEKANNLFENDLVCFDAGFVHPNQLFDQWHHCFNAAGYQFLHDLSCSMVPAKEVSEQLDMYASLDDAQRTALVEERNQWILES